jgi:hypothetical protein
MNEETSANVCFNLKRGLNSYISIFFPNGSLFAQAKNDRDFVSQNLIKIDFVWTTTDGIKVYFFILFKAKYKHYYSFKTYCSRIVCNFYKVFQLMSIVHIFVLKKANLIK